MHYYLQPVHNEVALYVQWNGMFFKQVSWKSKSDLILESNDKMQNTLRKTLCKIASLEIIVQNVLSFPSKTSMVKYIFEKVADVGYTILQDGLIFLLGIWKNFRAAISWTLCPATSIFM